MTGNILLVDDLPDLRRYTAIWLRLDGYGVVEAASAADALALMSADPLPDLVISDVMMPEMDGIEMLTAMRADRRTARVPVIMFSAVNEPGRIAAALAEGAWAYWVKGDVEPQQMLAEITRVIGLGSAGIPDALGQDPRPRRKSDPDLV